ncbi:MULTISPECIES: TetR/AcrR family transcriptional regulator [Caproicibacterium]|mgnify:FL=1|uniref:TetR/AcrR family transcriptional regulator n=1 Tax=Caproicibacterium TaxID=2834348 RepID=UPI001F30F1A2|nr:TetR/AcrR family transcriptional regulator [Caproicibacterium lactatifermentans]MDD4807427.1 TetR/AcrR family transcriptional regulator [Oscillospiraceae bacterium]
MHTINIAVTSKSAILKVCRDMVSEKGLSALNMRSVAQACHVALGSLYNYFSSKDDLVIATIESVWQDIFHMDHKCTMNLPFPEYVGWIFESVRRGSKEYPNFLTAHSLSFASTGKNKAKDTMQHYFSHIKMGMTEALNADTAIRKDAFTPAFTESDFIDFVLTNVLTMLMQKKGDCGVLLAIIRRTIYAD